MQTKLEQGELDVALIIEPQNKPFLTSKIIMQDSFKFYISTKSKLLFQDTKTAPLIYMPEAIAGDLNIESLFKKLKLENENEYTSSSLESVRELTLQGLGIGLLPELVAKSFVQKKKLKEVNVAHNSKSLGKHQIGFIYHKSNESKHLLNLLLSEFNDFALQK